MLLSNSVFAQPASEAPELDRRDILEGLENLPSLGDVNELLDDAWNKNLLLPLIKKSKPSRLRNLRPEVSRALLLKMGLVQDPVTGRDDINHLFEYIFPKKSPSEAMQDMIGLRNSMESARPFVIMLGIGLLTPVVSMKAFYLVPAMLKIGNTPDWLYFPTLAGSLTLGGYLGLKLALVAAHSEALFFEWWMNHISISNKNVPPRRAIRALVDACAKPNDSKEHPSSSLLVKFSL